MKRCLVLLLSLWIAACAGGPSFRYKQCSQNHRAQERDLWYAVEMLTVSDEAAKANASPYYTCIVEDDKRVLVWLQMASLEGRTSPVFVATSAAIDQVPSEDHLMFCVAHELAHLVLGHLDDTSVLRSTAVKRELEADLEAVRLLGKVGVKDPARVSAEALEWIKAKWDIKTGSAGPSKDHPAIDDRIGALRSASK